MAQESQPAGHKNESSNIPLYSIFEESLPKETKKSLLQKCLNNVSLLSRKNNTSSSNKIEGQVLLYQNNNESSLSNGGKDIREISDSKLSSDYQVHGFENEELSLIKMLFKHGDGQFKAIGVAGMSGVGKTTLCQKIFNREDVKCQFAPRVWVCLSRLRNNDKNLKVGAVKRILEHLGIEEDSIDSFNKGYGLDGLLYILHQQLIGKRYLIVLDDFQNTQEKEWCENLNSCSGNGKKWGEHISNGLPKGYGGTVIITSRNEEFTKKIVGEENFHQLQPLSDPDSCWSIYKDSVEAEGGKLNSHTSKELREELKKFENDIKLTEKQDPSSAKVTEIKATMTETEGKLMEQIKAEEELKRKCGGLPLVAKLMGKLKAELIPKHDAENAANDKTNLGNSIRN
ncbi:Disease resistance protein [Melia azedarach]|uniref:Disease resistance protein n=1 Tax=Melia azedarach TaxID=155640 RepID=A0ACC1YCI4_MELAZ|nr:Disease resistance protein [Melia azedarach]